MSELMSDALFGVDGTEPDALRFDPSGRGGWRDEPVLPPLTLPPIPNLGVTREAVAATLGEDPSWLVDPHHDSPPEQQPAAAPSTPSAQVTAPQPAPAAALAEGPAAAIAPDHSRPRMSAPVPLAAPSLPRSDGRIFRPPLAGGFRPSARFGDLRRRVASQGSGLPLQFGSNGGAGVFFFAALIIFVVLAYGIIAGIVESILRLFQ